MIKIELQFVDNNFDFKMLMYYLVQCLKQRKESNIMNWCILWRM